MYSFFIHFHGGKLYGNTKIGQVLWCWFKTLNRLNPLVASPNSNVTRINNKLGERSIELFPCLPICRMPHHIIVYPFFLMPSHVCGCMRRHIQSVQPRFQGQITDDFLWDLSRSILRCHFEPSTHCIQGIYPMIYTLCRIKYNYFCKREFFHNPIQDHSTPFAHVYGLSANNCPSKAFSWKPPKSSTYDT